MTDLNGAWSGGNTPAPAEPKLPAWDFLTYAKSSEEGPWNGLEDLFPEGKDQLPRSPKALLKAAQEHGWGFGPISLVMRLNRADAKPLYVSWLYSIPANSWSFAGAGVKGHHIAKAAEAMALVKTEPWKPDWSRYEFGADEGGTYVQCRECGPEWDADAEDLPGVLAWAETHEREFHVE